MTQDPDQDAVASASDVTAVVVNYKTYSLTRQCVESFRSFYPDGRMVLIDNGSEDDSSDYLVSLQQLDLVKVIVNGVNRHHGPALDQGVRACATRFAFSLDSDCELRHGGLLEQMLQLFDHESVYAVGKRGWTNRYGYGPISRRERQTHYIHPFALLLDRVKYSTLPPFVHHGAPGYKNMWGARRRGYELLHFPVEDFLVHHGRDGRGPRLRL